MDTLYFDIETGALPVEQRAWSEPKQENMKLGNLKDPEKIAAKVAEAKKEWANGDGCALDATTGRVLLIGYAENDGPIQFLEGTETAILGDFWRLADPGIAKTVTLVGHNVLSFDLPFLLRRSWLNGIKVSGRIWSDIQSYRPAGVVDTMREWGCGDRHHMVSLANLCGAFGLPVKTGPVTGATFSYWFEKDKEVAKEYCREDVEATRRLAKRMGVAG